MTEKHGKDLAAGDHAQMIREEHQKVLWVHLTNVVLGVWLITSPMTFGCRSFLSGLVSGPQTLIFGNFLCTWEELQCDVV
jgi:hypothetical protein